MNRNDRDYVLGLLGVVVAVLGTVIAVGALLDGVVALPVVDGDDVLVGAGIAVAGAGAAMSLRRQPTSDAAEPSEPKTP
jgi:hypothetical protein